jgi:hypothetical protein
MNPIDIFQSSNEVQNLIECKLMETVWLSEINLNICGL